MATPHSSSTHPDPLWQPFVEGVRSFVRHRVPVSDAEDVAQDVLLRLHRAAPSLRDASRAESWVYSITRRSIADYYRRKGRQPSMQALDDAEQLPDHTSASPERQAWFTADHSVHEEVLSWLRPAAENLPENYREALLMADFDGHTQQDVADALGLSLSGAKSRVQRARRKLREALQACCAIEFGPEGRAVAFERLQPCADC